VTAGELVAMVAFALIVAAAARAAAAFGGIGAAGFRPVRFGVRRLVVWSKDEGPRLRWRRIPRLYGPATLAVPRSIDTADGLRRRTARAWGSGPAAAVGLAALAGIVCFALELAYRRGLRAESSFRLDSLVFVVGLVSLLGFLLALLPRPARGFYAAHPWLRLLLSGDAREIRWSAAQALIAASHDGVRPRHWSTQLVAWASEPSDGSRGEAGGALLAYYHALDGGDTQGAASSLERARAASAGWTSRWARQTVLAETAFLAALYHRDVAGATQALRRAGRGRWIDPSTRARAHAALRAATGDGEEALRLVERGRAELGRMAVEAGTGIAALAGELLGRVADAAVPPAALSADAGAQPAGSGPYPAPPASSSGSRALDPGGGEGTPV
jgi:hypothetical protein